MFEEMKDCEANTTSIDGSSSYPKDSVEREHVSYAHQKESYEKRRSSITASTSDDLDVSERASDSESIHKSGVNEPDYTSFTALKNLDEEKIKQASRNMPIDSIFCADDTLSSYLKGAMEREHVSYAHELESYQKRRSSIIASSQQANDSESIHKSGVNEPDYISFTALKNLDEEKIKQASKNMPIDSIFCDYDTLCQLQRKPADLTKMCTTNTQMKVSTKYKTMQDVLDIPVTSGPKSKVVVDTASQFYNNFFG